MNKQINVLVDTNIIEDNTADGLRVVISEETPIVGEFTASDGTIVKGSGLTQTKQTTLTQGDLKTELASINNQIAGLITRQSETQSLLDGVSVAVDTAIVDKLKQPGTVDNRKP